MQESKHKVKNLSFLLHMAQIYPVSKECFAKSALCLVLYTQDLENMLYPQRQEHTFGRVRSVQSLRCPYEGKFDPWLSKLRPMKILIRQSEFAG